jgi:hypothetical protein
MSPSAAEGAKKSYELRVNQVGGGIQRLRKFFAEKFRTQF